MNELFDEEIGEFLKNLSEEDMDKLANLIYEEKDSVSFNEWVNNAK